MLHQDCRGVRFHGLWMDRRTGCSEDCPHTSLAKIVGFNSHIFLSGINIQMVSNEFKQEVFVEFLRRCAVCGYGSELNVLLIEPHLVSSDEDNRAENFICLCHECHTLAVRDRWGASVLREFRDKPWVARQFEGNGADEREKVKLTLTLKVDSESTDKTELLNFVKAAITGYTNGQTEK